MTMHIYINNSILGAYDQEMTLVELMLQHLVMMTQWFVFMCDSGFIPLQKLRTSVYLTA